MIVQHRRRHAPRQEIGPRRFGLGPRMPPQPPPEVDRFDIGSTLPPGLRPLFPADRIGRQSRTARAAIDLRQRLAEIQPIMILDKADGVAIPATAPAMRLAAIGIDRQAVRLAAMERALPTRILAPRQLDASGRNDRRNIGMMRSEEHTSELKSQM